jgi:hypothetical protein
MSNSLILLALLGKLLVYIVQVFPLTEKITNKNSFLRELVECDFCLGCWIYFFLNLFFRVWFEQITYVPILSPFLMGIFISFIVHLISLGWKEKFGVIVIE